MDKLQETIDRMRLLCGYDPSKPQLNEWGEKDSRGWINIGVVRGGSPFLNGEDAYLMVDPNAPQDENLSNFKWRHTTWNTKPDGTGKAFNEVTSYYMKSLQIYPEYRDTYYGEVFLGKRKTEVDERQHQEFMAKLNVRGGSVILKHNSDTRITDGVVRLGKKNFYSNNSDVGIYFWGSKHEGRDPSGGGQYTYFCLVPVSEIYDFQNNMERYVSLDEALKNHSYCAQLWKDDNNAVVVNTFTKTPIYAVRDNRTGKVYDAEWNETNLKVENRRAKSAKGNLLREQYPHTKNDADLVSINEVNAKTMLQRHGEDGFIVISPCRGYSTFRLDPNMPGAAEILARENNKRINDIIRQIKASGYSYTPVYGGFIENQGTENEQNVYERSFIIYNRSKNGEKGNMKNLVRFGQKLADQYQQDSFLVKAPGEKPKYVTADGNIDMEFSGNVAFNDFSQEYFTDFHKNTEKYKGDPSRKPTRFSYTESYVNPAPQCYSERHIRSLNGEIFVSDRNVAKEDTHPILATTVFTLDENTDKDGLVKDFRLGRVLFERCKPVDRHSNKSYFIAHNLTESDSVFMAEVFSADSVAWLKPDYSNSSVTYALYESDGNRFMARKGETKKSFNAKNDAELLNESCKEIGAKYNMSINSIDYITERISARDDGARLLWESLDEGRTFLERLSSKYELYGSTSTYNAELKENFRKRLERAGSLDEDVMKRYYGIATNEYKPVLIEKITLNRLLTKHGKDGMINISANRSDMPKEYNDEMTRRLIHDLKASGYSYLPTYGGYRGTDGVEDDYEPSFVVFNHSAKDGKPGDWEALKKFALTLCKRYRQDSVLLKAPGENPIWVDKSGNKANARESDTVWKNDPNQAYFTSLKSKDAVEKTKMEKLMGLYKKHRHERGMPVSMEDFMDFYEENKDKVDGIGRRYTYDISFECYVNPMPCSLNERRMRTGEVYVYE